MYVQTLIAVLAILFGRPAASEWKDADRLASDNRASWHAVWESFDVDPKECEAIIFPELIRYNRLIDKAETATLSLWYIRGGSSKSNFSVGSFQMKPGFVEQLEKEWMKSELHRRYQLYFVNGETQDLRQRRIKRIVDQEWQCVYLAIFVQLMLKREPSLREMSAEMRVRYLATAYNCGFHLPLSELDKRMKQRRFHLDYIQLPNTQLYRYSDLAVRRLRELS